MASGIYNRGLYEIASDGTGLSTSTLKVMLLNASHSFNRDHNFVSDIVANEITAAGYTRKTLSSPAFTEDDAADCAYFDMADPSWSGVTGSETAAHAVVFRDTGADATSPLIGSWALVPYDVSANGGANSLPWNSNGLIKFTSAT